jgi:hypothetical protein
MAGERHGPSSWEIPRRFEQAERVTFENGGQVRAVFTNDGGRATTNAGTLTVPWIFLSECPDLPSGQVQASPGGLPRLVAHLTWTRLLAHGHESSGGLVARISLKLDGFPHLRT